MTENLIERKEGMGDVEPEIKETTDIEGFEFDIETSRLKIFENLYRFIEETNINVDSTSIKCGGTDSGKVAFCRIILDGIEVKGQPEPFRISTEMFVNMLKRIKAKNVNVSFKGNRLTLKTDEKKLSMAVFGIMEEEPLDIDKLQLDSSFFIDADDLDSALKDAVALGYESVFLSAEGKNVSIIGKETKADMDVMITLNEKNQDPVIKCIGRYSIDYLKKLKFDDMVKIEMGIDMPIRISNGGFTIVIAPRIPDD